MDDEYEDKMMAIGTDDVVLRPCFRLSGRGFCCVSFSH